MMKKLQPAFDACENLAEFGAAVQKSPEAVGELGSDVDGWAQQQREESETRRPRLLLVDPVGTLFSSALRRAFATEAVEERRAAHRPAR